MSDQEFKNYVALISKLLHLKQGQQESIGGELKDHLQTRVADLIDDGVPEEAAFQQALEEFGDAAAMARNFQSVLDLKRRRWMMRFTTLAVAGAFLAAIFTMAMWPAGARFGAPAATMATTQDDSPFDEAKPTALMQVQLSPATKSDLATEKTLEQLTDLHYEANSFADIMKDLGDRLRLNFMLDMSARDDGLSEDQEITIRLSQVPLSKGLMLMLREFNATYIIDEGIVRIISIDESNDAPFLRMKMFDCKALSKRYPNQTLSRWFFLKVEAFLEAVAVAEFFVCHPDRQRSSHSKNQPATRSNRIPRQANLSLRSWRSLMRNGRPVLTDT